MSGSSRNRYSQWGLRDEPEFAPDSKQLWSGLTSADVARGNASKWSYLDGNEKLRPNWGFSSKESFAGDRGSSKDDLTIKDYIRSLDATVAWDRDRSYSAKISPGFKEWKHKRHGQSPKHNWGRSVRSRSRSRSPAHSFRWDSGVNDRYRMKLTQSCRAFRARKCRRGNNCHFLHHDNENYEDSGEKRHKKDGAPRYSAPHKNRDYSLRSGKSNEICINFKKGRCRMGPSCKYVHHDNCDGFSKGPVDESTRERETDRRVRENSFEQAGGHEPNLSGDTSCRFFAARKCHNGKYCRLSHDRPAFRSPQRRLRNDRWGSNPGGDQLLNRLKWSVSVSPSGRLGDDRWGSDENMVDANKMRNGPKWNDTAAISNSAKLDEGTYGNIDAPKSGFTAWPLISGWGHSLDENQVLGESPVLRYEKEANQWKPENAGAIMGVSQSIGSGKWLYDAEMSPDWNYRFGSSGHSKEDHGQNKHGLNQDSTYLAVSEYDRKLVAPGQDFNQNAQNVDALHPSSCLMVVLSQEAVPIVPLRGGNVVGMQNQEMSRAKNYSLELNIMDASSPQVGCRNPPTHNIAGNEHIAQLTNLSASLAHSLGIGQRLPELYATLNSHHTKDTPPLAKTEGFGEPVSTTFIRPDSTVGFQKQYYSMCDSIEPKKAEACGVPPGFAPCKRIAEHEIGILSLLSNSGRINCGDPCKIAISEKQDVVMSDNIVVVKQNNQVVGEERSDSQDHRNTEENGPLGNLDQNGVPEEARKTKDVKGIRSFKFSLVEFVKELLKPGWKEGQITKEDYKTIVKKVVDKVTGTLKRAHIPQTQEKIDHYLSFSKEKLHKLVQAYVAKVQKA